MSFVVPASAVGYTLGAVGAKWLLQGQVTLMRWAGVFLISSGVLRVLVG